MPQIPPLTFDAASHSYHAGSRRLPHVTGIIGNTIPRQFSPGDWYLQRGAAIHQAIHLLVADDLDWSTVDERIIFRIRAFQRFIAETGYVVVESEIKLWSPALQYAGTIDALMDRASEGLLLVDFKSSLEPQVSIQLGAYYRLLQDNRRDVVKALALELKDDGRYNCRWFTKPELKRAAQTFHACLTVNGWMERNNLTPKE